MVYHVQPIMILALLPFAIGFESTRVATSVSLMRFTSLSTFIQTISLVAVGGFIAFLMECAEFLLVSYTSGLTLSVAGIVKEIISLTLAVIFQSSDISAINMLGLVICMTGITLHVLRKASSVEARGSTERSSRRGPRGSPGQKESLLSQSESDDDSEVEVFHTSRSTRASTPSEEPFMRDHRQWTGVRDSHLAGAAKTPDFSVQVDDEDIEVTTGDIVDLASDDGEGGDALDEADQLLEQLDLLSSD